MPRAALLAALAAAALLVPAGAVAQGPQYPDPAGYCTPENTFYNPPDTEREAQPLQLPRGFTRRDVVLGGYRTKLIEGGPRDSREAIVFMHGNPGSSVDWEGVLRAAPRGARVIAFDMVGFGAAEKPWDFDYSLDAVVPVAERIVAELGLERVHLVGHDIGGVVGLEWASRHPDMLASATLLASGVLIGYEDHKYAQAWKTPVQGEAFQLATTRELFVNSIQGDQPRPLPREFLDRNYDFYDRPTRCAILKAYRAAGDVSALGEQQARRLRPHDRPALVIFGDSDPYIPAEIAERQREAFPSASIHLIENSGHWPFVDEPDRTVALMKRFFRRHVSAR